MNDVATKLREAKALIERGWTRGQYECNGRVCARGAINAAFNGDPECWSDKHEQAAAERLLKEAIGRSNLVQWNDTRDSKHEVLAAFDRAIALAEADHA